MNPEIEILEIRIGATSPVELAEVEHAIQTAVAGPMNAKGAILRVYPSDGEADSDGLIRSFLSYFLP